jgi:hypothetical protein
VVEAAQSAVKHNLSGRFGANLHHAEQRSAILFSLFPMTDLLLLT